MEPSKATSGRWLNVGGGPSYYDIISADHEADRPAPRICRVYRQTKECDANANLICAAPLLLEACKMALCRIESDIEFSTRHTTVEGDALRAAITVAETGGEG